MFLEHVNSWKWIFFIGLTFVGPILILMFVDYFSDLTRTSYDVFGSLKKNLTLKNYHSLIANTYYVLWLIILFLGFIFKLSDLQLFYIWILLILGLIDWQVRFLPDILTLSLLWLGLLSSASSWSLLSPESAIWGAVIVYSASRFLGFLFYLWRGKEGLGRGDMKLLAAMAAWTGLMGIVPIIFLASVMAVIVGLAVIMLKRNFSLSMPFGPFLSTAALTHLILLKVFS